MSVSSVIDEHQARTLLLDGIIELSFVRGVEFDEVRVRLMEKL